MRLEAKDGSVCVHPRGGFCKFVGLLKHNYQQLYNPGTIFSASSISKNLVV